MNQAMTVSSSNGSPVNASTTTDTISGDSLTLALQTFGTAQSGSLNFTITRSNASAYGAAGYLQFDIELGPGFSSAANQQIQVQYGPAYSGGCVYNFAGAPAPTLSATAFTRVTIPFTSFGSCNDLSTLSVLTIGFITTSGSAVASGTMFYVDDVQWDN
jgi:hypothetical protein